MIPPIMRERLALATFVVRIYRADEKDCRKLNGIAEQVDGIGRQWPFADVTELATILITIQGAPETPGHEIL